MSVWWLELRRSSLISSLPLLVGCGVLAAERAAWPGVADWGNASSAIAGSGQLIAPLATAWAAWAGSRERRCRVADLVTLSTRSRSAAASRELVAALTWAALSYLVVCAVVLAQTLARGGSGVGSTWWMLAGLLGLLALVGWGWVAGRLLPFRATPPLIAFATYFGTGFLMQRPQWWHLLSPVLVQDDSPWLRTRPVVFAAESLASVASLGAAVLVYALVKERRSHRVTVMLLGLPLLAVAAGAGLMGRATHGYFFGAARVPSYACATTPVQMCVVGSYRAGLPELESRLDAGVERLHEAGIDLPLVRQLPRGIGGIPSHGEVALHLDDLAQRTLLAASGEVVASLLAPEQACDAAPPEAAAFNVTVVSEVTSWILRSAELAPPADQNPPGSRWWASLTDADRGRWLRLHRAALQGCSVTSADLVTG